mmetsp:Transcript_53656/g.106776  ORF Transcript_53656/g.106776 Transcript_53656/m.106776 type:complete len:125 (-) Transcript_53656:45-419(-)
MDSEWQRAELDRKLQELESLEAAELLRRQKMERRKDAEAAKLVRLFDCEVKETKRHLPLGLRDAGKLVRRDQVPVDACHLTMGQIYSKTFSGRDLCTDSGCRWVWTRDNSLGHSHTRHPMGVRR